MPNDNSITFEKSSPNNICVHIPTDMAKAYYAILRVSNDAGRTAKLQPDKGKPEGFLIQPNKPMEITLIDLSTDGKSVAPVYFNASDVDIGLSLLINNNIHPHAITPVESPTDYIDLVITSPCKYTFEIENFKIKFQRDAY